MAGIHKKKRNASLSEDSVFVAEKALTAQQRAEIAREEKKQQRSLRRAERAQLRSSMRARLMDENRAFRFVCFGILVFVVVLAAVVLLANLSSDGWDEKLGVTYYLNSADVPDMPEKGISAVINEVCYAENGGLLVSLTFANGEATTQHPVSMQLKICNGDDEILTDTSVSTFPEKYFINSGGYKDFDIRIPKKYVRLADDSLETISYEVTVTSEEYMSLEGD